MTFKDLRKRISSSGSQQQTQSFDKVQNKPFWIWNIEEHKLEDIRTKGECFKSPFLFELFWLCGLPSFIILGKRYKFSINRKRPLFEQFLASGFILLTEEEVRELVVGGIGQFWKLWGGSFHIIDNTRISFI